MMGPAALLPLLLALAGEAQTEVEPPWRGLVVVLAPVAEDAVTRNALARISGELAAAPFKTITTPINVATDVMVQVETAGQELSAVAAFAIVRDPEPSPDRVTIWVSNRVTHTTTMHRMQVQGGDVDRAAARLAVEAVELVRASLAGLWPSQARTTPPPTTPVVEEAPQPAPRTPVLALAAGAAVWQDMSSAPGMLAPFVAITFGNAEWLGVRLMASGLGTGADVTTPSGSIRIERSMASLGLVRLFRPQRVVQPILSVAAGIHYLFAHGTSAPLPAYDRSAISALASASGGLALALGPRLSLVAELEALFYLPSDIIRANGVDVVRFDRPTLFAHAGLLASF
jgi:hypothetical protein